VPPQHDHDQRAARADTDRVHDTSWSANLETPRHAEDVDRVVTDALAAIEHTRDGRHVNLVTHGDHGHPSEYLYGALADAVDPERVTWAYVDRCGCGGRVTRVHVG
jgi:putative CGCGG family rSAM target protein